MSVMPALRRRLPGGCKPSPAAIPPFYWMASATHTSPRASRSPTRSIPKLVTDLTSIHGVMLRRAKERLLPGVKIWQRRRVQKFPGDSGARAELIDPNARHREADLWRRFFKSSARRRSMVPMEGVEPTHSYEYQILSLARLPIPPHRPPGRKLTMRNLRGKQDPTTRSDRGPRRWALRRKRLEGDQRNQRRRNARVGRRRGMETAVAEGQAGATVVGSCFPRILLMVASISSLLIGF